MEEFKEIVNSVIKEEQAVEDNVSTFFEQLTKEFKGSDTLKRIPKETEKLFKEMNSIKKKKDKDKHLVENTIKITTNIVEDLFKEKEKMRKIKKDLKLYDLEDFVRKSSKRIVDDKISIKFRREKEFIYIRRDGINGYFLARVKWKSKKNRPINVKLGHQIFLNAVDDRIIYITVPNKYTIALDYQTGIITGYEILK
jgi:tyrosyl-tRNA synthetase